MASGEMEPLDGRMDGWTDGGHSCVHTAHVGSQIQMYEMSVVSCF